MLQAWYYGKLQSPLRREAVMKKKRSMLPFYIIIIPVVFVAIILNTGILQSRVTALTVGNHTLTTAEFNYYYYSVSIDFTNENYDQLAELGYSASTKPQNQDYAEGVTWADHFKEEAFTRLTRVLYLNDLAEEDGYVFEESDYEPVLEKLAKIESYCQDYSLGLEDYFKSYYGSGMTKTLFETQLRLEVQADVYSAYLAKTLDIEDAEAEINQWIAKNSAAANEAATLRIIYLAAAADRFAGEITQTQLDDLEIKTERLLERWIADGGDETAFAWLADTFSEEENLPAGGLYEGLLREEMPEDLAAWCFDSTRKAGEFTSVQTDSGAYAALYLDGGEAVMRQVAEAAIRQEAVASLIQEQTKDWVITEHWLGMQLSM